MYTKTEKKSQEVLRLYQEGKKLTEICKETVTSQPTVKKILQSFNIDYDSVEKIKYQEKLDLVLKLYEEGKSQLYIEKELNLTRKTIRELLKSKDLHYKTKSEQWRIRYGSTLNEDVFTPPLSEEALYWLGFLYADGHILKKRGYSIELGIHSDDLEHVKKYAKFLGASNIIDFPKNKDIARLRVGSEKLHKSLQNLGFDNQKSYSAKPHELAKDSKDFWRGVVDGDGGIYNRADRTRQVFICGTLDTVVGFIEFVETFSEIKNRKVPSKCKGKSLYQVSYYSQEAENVADLLYRNSKVYLERKYKVYKDWNL